MISITETRCGVFFRIGLINFTLEMIQHTFEQLDLFRQPELGLDTLPEISFLCLVALAADGPWALHWCLCPLSLWLFLRSFLFGVRFIDRKKFGATDEVNFKDCTTDNSSEQAPLPPRWRYRLNFVDWTAGWDVSSSLTFTIGASFLASSGSSVVDLTLCMTLQCPTPLCRFSYGQSHMQYGLHVALTILI